MIREWSVDKCGEGAYSEGNGVYTGLPNAVKCTEDSIKHAECNEKCAESSVK